jgi:calcineurin-like phosphoesterase family protein
VPLFFTSDHHFGHRNIIDYCKRPFPDLERMREYFVRIWNHEIGPDDWVWVLGDVALGRLDESLEVIAELNGRKLLMPGNHDRCFAGHKKAARERQRYLDAGFEAVLDGPRTLTIAGQSVTVSHFPYRSTGVLDEATVRYAEYRPVDDGGWLLHGHIHERWRIRGRQINVGVDAWAGHPVQLAQVEHYMAESNPHDREPYSWPKSAGMTAEEYAEYAEYMRGITRRQLRKAFGLAFDA